MNVFKSFLKLVFLLLFSTSILAKIIATINPISSLIKEITQDKNTVNTLLSHGPHISALKPSQIQMINNSDIVFYVHDDLEEFIPKLLPNLKHKKVVNITEGSNLKLLNKNTNDKENNKTHEGHEHKKHDESKHKHIGNKDLHIWLGLTNAKKIVKFITTKLSDRYPQNKSFYQQNATKTINKLNKLQQKISTMLVNNNNNKIIIFHNAYNYFLSDYNLKNSVLNSVSNKNLSIKKILNLQELIKNNNISCIVTDKKYNKKIINKLIINTNIEHKILKPIGSKNVDYFSLLTNIANNLESCFK